MTCPLPHGVDLNGIPRVEQADIGILCRRHRQRMDKLNEETAILWCELNLVIDGSLPREASEKTRHLKSPEAPAPCDLTAVSLRDPRSYGEIPAVPHIVASWLLLVAEERPLTMTLPKGVVGQLDLLARHHDWMAGQDWVDDYLLELAELRKALAGAVRDRTHRKIGHCNLPVASGICGGVLLKENGTGVIKCVDCGAAWVTAQEQARLAVSLEESA